MKRTPWPIARQWLPLVVALLLLNAAVTFHNVWPTLWITTRHEFSIEIAVLVLLLAAYSEIFGPPRRWLMACLTVPLLAMCIGRYAEVTAPALYGRPVNVYWDAQHLPKVAAMLAEVASPWLLAVGALGLIVLLGALIYGLHWSLARVWDGLGAAATRRALGAFAASLVALYAVSWALESSPRYWFSLPVTATYGQQAAFLVEALVDGAQRSVPVEPLAQSDLQGVAGADVLLIFLESYGATAYDDPAISQVVGPSRAALQTAAATTGRRVVSAFVESPTFGGASWLAHSTLMSGVEVKDTGMYNLLLTQSRETLPKRFADSGYRAIAWMPGLRNAWPEGQFYGFDAIYGERELDYRGPDFGWWRIPDQYALAKLDATELGRAARAPLFVFFSTINTHVPFRPTPPLQPTWSRLLTEEPYDAPATAASLARQPEWTNLGPAYAETLAYTFAYFASYLQERPDADFVMVLVGDHQPAASVSGQGARWEVPVHVITARDGVQDALLEAGFTPGIELAAAGQPIGGMRALTTLLLRAFDSSGSLPLTTPGYGSAESAR